MIKRQIPRLSDDIVSALYRIGANCEGYFPCDITLRDGSEVCRVYLAEAEKWIVKWGLWPEADVGKKSVDAASVAAVMRSQQCLPTRFANELYEAGESGMGYTIFTVHFADGSSSPVVTGSAVDFVSYPLGQSARTVVEVSPHIGREENPQKSPDYHWCLFRS